MTPEAYRALPVGTEVFLRAPVVDDREVDSDGDVRVGFPWGDYKTTWVPLSAVECVAPPKPRPIIVGSRVTWGNGTRDYEVLAIHDDVAFVRSGHFYDLQPTTNLRHATP